MPMENVDKIVKALAAFDAHGVAALHETAGPAVIFTTECNKVYRVDFGKPPSDDTISQAVVAIEKATGLRIDWCGGTRGAEARDAAQQARDAASRKLSDDITRETKPVDTQASHKAQMAAAEKGARP